MHEPTHGCRAVARWRAHALLLALAALLVAVPVRPAVAAESPDADALGLRATAGVDGHYVTGGWTPVEVRLEPDDAFAGRLVLSAAGDGGRVLTSLDVEVAAGTEKRFLLLAPPATNVLVQAVADGADSGTTLRPGGERVRGFLVGVLGDPGSDQLPDVTLPMTDQRAEYATVDEDLLALGPRALAAVSTLAVRQADLAALDDDARATVTAAVATGMQLLVTEVTDPDLGLPWRPATEVADGELVPAPGAWGRSVVEDGGGPDGPVTAAAVAAGRGRVTALVRPLAASGSPEDARLWEDLLQPATAALSPATSSQWSNLPGDVESTFSAVAGEPTSLRWLGGFFVAYLVVVGPVLGIVLSRRRRPELAWVAVPVVTAVFAGAAFLGASGARPRIGVTARVDTWVDGIGEQLVVAGVRSPRAGEHEVVLPATGWDVVGVGWNTAARVATGEATTVSLSQPGQSFGAVLGLRPTDAPPPLDLEIALFDGEARVEATNVGTEPVADLRLRLAGEVVELADALPVGETLIETVALPDGLPADPNPFGGGVAFDQFDQFGRPVADDAVALESLVRWRPVDRTPGLVWVLGTVPAGAAAGTSVDGTAPTDRGRLLAVGVTPATTDDATLPFEVQRDLLLPAGDGLWRDGPTTVSGTGPAPLRFRLPREGAVQALRLRLDAGAGGGMGQGGIMEPERCGLLEVRDDGGDLVSSEDHCGSSLPCPMEAVSCESTDGGDRVEGQVCFDDGTCQEQVWRVEGGLVPAPPEVGAGGLQVWDRLDRGWVDVAGLPDTGRLDEVERWLSPLGEVWVRGTGEFFPWDLSPQAVSAELEGTT